MPALNKPPLIVGIGASAGGLDASQRFLAKVPADCGAAFVIVQHLDPKHGCLTPGLFQQVTSMKVLTIEDLQHVEANQVYVLPPNKDLSILHGSFHLLDQVRHNGLPLPIDFFLHSLAADQGPHCVGVILSGMGSDGSSGLRAIREKGGLTLAQSPASCQYASMPQSVIDAGLTDMIATPEELALLLFSPNRPRPPLPPPPSTTVETARETAAPADLEKIAVLLRARTGHDFSRYKSNTILRRVQRRMDLRKLKGLPDYIHCLQENDQELDLLFRELLIGVTQFFRDLPAWEFLSSEILPSLLRRNPARRQYRAWVAGCSSGEEAYSLSIAFQEACDTLDPNNRPRLQIFATDLDPEAIDKARRGLFPETIATQLSETRLRRFFRREETGGYKVAKELRETIIFSLQNLTMDPPFTRLDLLCCRNLLIYLELELQKKLLPLFHYCLLPGGVLFLGNSESIGNFGHLFNSLNTKARIFQRAPNASPPERIDFPSSFVPPKLSAASDGTVPMKSDLSFQAQAEQLILQLITPPALLTNEKGDILFINGRTGRFLEPAAGKANWNLFAMTREHLRGPLLEGFQRALQEPGTVVLSGLHSPSTVEGLSLRVSLRRISGPEDLQGLLLIVFQEQAEATVLASSDKGNEPPLPTEANDALRMLEQRLSDTRGQLHSAREEMKHNQEELRSAIEELQSTNEELQSTNEELTTSKEELQSLNEELQTVNAELQAKVDELSRANNDMQNLLNSTDIATVFLDNQLNIRRFTTQATRIIKLIKTDIGRPVTDLSSSLLYPELEDDSREVLDTLRFHERRITTKDKHWYAVRIMPYRTVDNRIDGVVITFSDITTHRENETGPPESETQSPS